MEEQRSSSRRMQYFAAFAVSLAGMTIGFSIYWSTPMLPKFRDHETGINITETEISWMASLLSPGLMIGSLASSFLADRFGRKPVLLGSALPIAIGTVLLLCATTPWMLYMMRFLWGCGAGLYVTMASLYIAEIADKDIRGRLTMANRFMINFGSFNVMTIGPFLTYKTLNYILLLLPIGYFVVCWLIPESPYFLLKAGKVDAARKELQVLRRFKDEKILEDQLSIMRSDVKKQTRHSSSAKELFTGRQYRKAIIIAVGIKLTQMLAGSVPILQYLGLIIQESKMNMKVSTALIIFGAVRFVVGIFSSILVDKVGRRPLLISTYTGSSICLAMVGINFYCREVLDIHIDSSSPLRYLTLAGIISSNIISTFGFDSLVYIIVAEIFPLNVKSIAVAALYVCSGCSTFLVVRGYQVIKDLTGLYGVFWFFALAAFIGAVFSYFFVPETMGKSLSQIQKELQGDYYEDEVCENLNKIHQSEVNVDGKH